jgi:hypothetical protein
MSDTKQTQGSPGPFDKEKAEGSQEIVDRELARQSGNKPAGRQEEDKPKDGRD